MSKIGRQIDVTAAAQLWFTGAVGCGSLLVPARAFRAAPTILNPVEADIVIDVDRLPRATHAIDLWAGLRLAAVEHKGKQCNVETHFPDMFRFFNSVPLVGGAPAFIEIVIRSITLHTAETIAETIAAAVAELGIARDTEKAP